MAHKWNPKTDPVGKQEPIGRRLYDEPMLMGAQNQPSFRGLDYRHFEETRDDGELSLDRLGCTGIEKKAKNYLKPRAVAAGDDRKPPRQFNGWTHVRASVLENGWCGQCYPVTASPLDLEGLQGNTHHAHIVIQGDATTLHYVSGKYSQGMAGWKRPSGLKRSKKLRRKELLHAHKSARHLVPLLRN